MRKSYGLILIVLLVVALSVLAQGKPPLRLVRSIPMPGFEGGDFDHFEADLKGNRLFLAAEDQKRSRSLISVQGSNFVASRYSETPTELSMSPIPTDLS